MILKMKCAAATGVATAQARSMPITGPVMLKKSARKRVTPIKPISSSSTIHSIPEPVSFRADMVIGDMTTLETAPVEARTAPVKLRAHGPIGQ